MAAAKGAQHICHMRIVTGIDGAAASSHAGICAYLQGGSVEEQVPAIDVNGKYFCPLTLRMQKSIWRHVRLRKGFVNMERLSQVRE